MREIKWFLPVGVTFLVAASLTVTVLHGADSAAKPELGGVARASAAPASPTNGPAFAIRNLTQQVPNLGPIRRGILTLGTNEITFVVPSDFRIQSDSATREISLSSRMGHCTLVLQFSVNTNAVSSETVLKLVKAEATQYRMEDEFSLWAAQWSGPAAKFVWLSSGGTRMSSTVGLIATVFATMTQRSVAPLD